MFSKLIALVVTVFSLSLFSYAQSGGMQVVLVDGSVKTLRVQTDFPLTTAPSQVRVRIAKLPATTLEACMASMDFSTATRMNPRMYSASYNTATRRQSFSFGVEREMKESGEGSAATTAASCHVVRLALSEVDGRDFLIWQRGGSFNLGAEAVVGDKTSAVRSANQRQSFLKMLTSSGF
jgi:hypothetical protein